MTYIDLTTEIVSIPPTGDGWPYSDGPVTYDTADLWNTHVRPDAFAEVPMPMPMAEACRRILEQAAAFQKNRSAEP